MILEKFNGAVKVIILLISEIMWYVPLGHWVRGFEILLGAIV
jgi:hypothetical protein